MIRLYGFSASIFVRKVRFVLEYKSLKYELDQVFPGKDTATLKLSPLGKIPYLTDGDFNISDSSVICQYLERKYPQESLYPSSAESLAKALWLEEYNDTKLTEIITGIYFQKIAQPNFFNSVTDYEVIKGKEAQFTTVFDYLEQQLEAGARYLVDDKLTIADVSLAANISNYFYMGYELDEQKWPKLFTYSHKLMNETFIKSINLGEVDEMKDFLAQVK